MPRNNSSNTSSSSSNTTSSDRNGIKRKVPKFNGDVVNLHRFLTDLDLFVRQIPSLRPLSGKQPKSDADLRQAEASEIEREETLYYYVRTSLPDDLATYLTVDDKSPYNGCGLIQRLKEHFQVSSDTYSLQIEKEINELTISPGDDIIKKLTELDNKLNFLDRSGQGKTEPQKVHILLRALTQEFEDLIKKWRAKLPSLDHTPS